MRKLYGMAGLTHGFILRNNASKFPNKPAVIDIERNKKCTYARLKRILIVRY
ncbi:MAG: hypothetical protein ACOY40_01570 [Bacillota bacterium]